MTDRTGIVMIDLPIDIASLIFKIDRELAVEEHRFGLEYGLTIDHCQQCREVYIDRNCPHTDEFTLQTLDMPVGQRYCSVCGKHLGQSW
jgi:hypothetical protein